MLDFLPKVLDPEVDVFVEHLKKMSDYLKKQPFIEVLTILLGKNGKSFYQRFSS